MTRTDKITVTAWIAALVLVILMAACPDALAQVPIYTKPQAGVTNITQLATLEGGEDSIIAHAGGGQASATALSATVLNHRVTGVVTAGDSVALPSASTVGLQHYVRNDGPNTMQVFGTSPDTINGVATATGIPQAAGMGVWYVVTTAGAWTTSPVTTFRADGLVGTPAFASASDPTTGMYYGGSSTVVFSAGGTAIARIANAELQNKSNSRIGWSSGAIGTASDLFLQRDGANTLAQANGTNAQVNRLYFSTTGPVYFQQTARTAGVLFTGSGGAMQLSFAQTTVPTCSTNCGTSPSVVGSDTSMVVTMGASGAPASGWIVTFNGTWPAAPSCLVQSGLSTMVVGKMPIAVQTSTTTLTVTTNGTAPGNSDKYNVQCTGVS